MTAPELPSQREAETIVLALSRNPDDPRYADAHPDLHRTAERVRAAADDALPRLVARPDVIDQLADLLGGRAPEEGVTSDAL